MLSIDMTSLTRLCRVMALTYSICEAKARYSEVIRRVREGRTVIVSCRGEPVAEIRAIGQHPAPTLGERLEELEYSGVLVRPALPKRRLRPVERRPGALARFLAERGE